MNANQTRTQIGAEGSQPGASNLLVAAKAALAALSQNATLPADIAAARKWLADAIESSSGSGASR